MELGSHVATVKYRQLLQHAAGWGRYLGSMGRPAHCAHVVSVLPAPCAAIC